VLGIYCSLETEEGVMRGSLATVGSLMVLAGSPIEEASPLWVSVLPASTTDSLPGSRPR
jgi:hypothetical protein